MEALWCQSYPTPQTHSHLLHSHLLSESARAGLTTPHSEQSFVDGPGDVHERGVGEGARHGPRGAHEPGCPELLRSLAATVSYRLKSPDKRCRLARRFGRHG